MRKTKIFSILGLIVFFSALIIILYFNKKYTIDFSTILPKNFIFCNKTINASNSEYKILKKWLNAHQKGWKNTLATYAQTTYFYNDSISINIHSNRVIVNYSDFNKNLHQLIHEKNTNELNFMCK